MAKNAKPAAERLAKIALELGQVQKELSAEDEAQILKLYTSHRFFLFEFLSGAQPFQILQNQRTSRRMPLKVGKVRSGFMVCGT